MKLSIDFDNSRIQIFLILVLSLCLSSCSNERIGCYTIGFLNLSIESPIMESVFYEFSDQNIIDQITGDSIVANIRETKINKIIILENKDTVDISTFSRIKKIKNGIHLINRSPRFIGIGDTTKIVDKIKDETLVLLLKNGQSLKLNMCD